MKRKLRERFFVTPIEGRNFSGVLLDQDGAYAVFGDVKIHPQDGDAIPAVGELYIRHDNVAYAQLMPHVDS